MDSQPKGACKPRALGAKRPCRRWQPLGALSPQKCAAFFLISNRLIACSKVRQIMFRPRIKLSTLPKAILLPDWEHNSTSCKPHPTSLGLARRDSAQSTCTTWLLPAWRTPARVRRKRSISDQMSRARRKQTAMQHKLLMWHVHPTNWASDEAKHLRSGDQVCSRRPVGDATSAC